MFSLISPSAKRFPGQVTVNTRRPPVRPPQVGVARPRSARSLYPRAIPFVVIQIERLSHDGADSPRRDRDAHDGQ